MSLIRNISDTARWAAVYRARENESARPLFKDPFARQLAGDLGEEIAKTLPYSDKNSWSWIARTYVYDQFILNQIQAGCDMVVNLAAGLDARPYRLELPSTLNWIEVDLPETIEYKTQILANEQPKCALERVALDLSDTTGRQDLLGRLSARARRAVVITEGLIIYLSTDAVAELATDLASQPSFRFWIVDLVSPPLLKLLQKTLGKQLAHGNAHLQLAPAEGPEFFSKYGWRTVASESMFHTAGRLHRLPTMFRLLYLVQRSAAYNARRPWGGVCLLENISGGSQQ